MPRKKFVREIKAKEVKNINPNDIIYLAMKDGSIILIADDDEDIMEYDDIKININNSYRKTNKKENNNDKRKISLNTSYDLESKKNYGTNNFIYNSKDNNINNNNYRTNSTSYKTINNIKNTPKISANNIKIKLKENERMNRSINYSNSKYKINNERLDSSFDSISIPKKNHAYHVVEYFNDTKESFNSNKPNSSYYERPRSNRDHYNSNSKINKEIPRRKTNTFIYDNSQRTNNHLVNISDVSFDSDNNSVLNRTNYLDKDRKNREYYKPYKKEINGYNYKNINSFNKRNQIRSQSLSNRNIGEQKNYIVQKKEIEIMGKIVNDRNSYTVIDHRHPNTLFEPKCHLCQNLARDNKLCLCNIQEESIYDNHSFLATFGSSGRKKGRSQNKYSENYYL